MNEVEPRLRLCCEPPGAFHQVIQLATGNKMADLYPFSSSQRTLLVGEGNLSFAACISEAIGFPPGTLYATCYEPKETVLNMHADVASFIETLERRKVEIRFCVDATALATVLEQQKWEPFHHIHFNFPHVGEAKIQKNRHLLANFFRSAKEALLPGGLVSVALCKGQGGTPADTGVRTPGNHWAVVTQAAQGQFILRDILPYPTMALAGYSSTGRRAKASAFNTKEALVHVFVPESTSLKLDAGSTSLDEFHSLQAYAAHIKSTLKWLEEVLPASALLTTAWSECREGLGQLEGSPVVTKRPQGFFAGCTRCLPGLLPSTRSCLDSSVVQGPLLETWPRFPVDALPLPSTPHSTEAAAAALQTLLMSLFIRAQGQSPELKSKTSRDEKLAAAPCWPCAPSCSEVWRVQVNSPNWDPTAQPSLYQSDEIKPCSPSIRAHLPSSEWCTVALVWQLPTSTACAINMDLLSLLRCHSPSPDCRWLRYREFPWRTLANTSGAHSPGDAEEVKEEQAEGGPGKRQRVALKASHEKAMISHFARISHPWLQHVTLPLSLFPPCFVFDSSAWIPPMPAQWAATLQAPAVLAEASMLSQQAATALRNDSGEISEALYPKEYLNNIVASMCMELRATLGLALEAVRVTNIWVEPSDKATGDVRRVSITLRLWLRVLGPTALSRERAKAVVGVFRDHLVANLNMELR